MSAHAATGFAAGDHAVPELAAMAVRDALASAHSDYAHGLLLFLSGHFIHHAQAAVTAASRTARCLQVCGCTVPGLFTENSWALDQPAAAVLALCGPLSLGVPRDGGARLTFALPTQADPAWMGDGKIRYGTLATDGESESEGKLWTQGKVAADGRLEMALHGGQLHLGVSRGVRALTAPLEVRDCDSFEILQLDDDAALDNLVSRLDDDIRRLDALPPQRIFAAVPHPGLDPQRAMADGSFALVPILQVNRDERSVTLAAPLPLGSHLWWVSRDPDASEADMRHVLDSLSGHEPAFAMMFSCIGRGPYFYQGHDRDLLAVREHFPGLPVIGAYCGGEIAPVGLKSSLISYSSVLALASRNV